MIKVEYSISVNPDSDTGEVAFAFEGSRDSDLPGLDALLEVLSGGYVLKTGFMDTKRLVLKAQNVSLPPSCNSVV